MVCEDKRRYVIRRLLPPPSFPRVIWPRTAHRSEHVPPENPRAQVLHAPPRPLIIRTSRAPFLPLHLLPGTRGEKPLEQLRAANSERILEALARTSGETINRHSKRTDPNCRHALTLRVGHTTSQRRRAPPLRLFQARRITVDPAQPMVTILVTVGTVQLVRVGRHERLSPS